MTAFRPGPWALRKAYVWILTQIRPDSGSPMAGWPESKVRIMSQNKARGQAGATSAKFFPLQHSEFDTNLITATPELRCVLRWPGVGKTPMPIVMGLALSRYRILSKGIDGVKPAWRRAKSLDNFRHRVGLIHDTGRPAGRQFAHGRHQELAHLGRGSELDGEIQ